MFTFTIHVPTWLQGELDSYLLRDDHKKCCLGFYLEALGVPLSHLHMRSTPTDALSVPEDAQWLLKKEVYDGDGNVELLTDSDISADLINFNDSRYDNRSQYYFVDENGKTPADYYSWLLDKMRAIQKRFAKVGVEVRWEGIA